MEHKNQLRTGNRCTVGVVLLQLSSEDRNWLIGQMIAHPQWTSLTRDLAARTGLVVADRVLSRHAYGECRCGVILATKRRKPNPVKTIGRDHGSRARRAWDVLIGLSA